MKPIAALAALPLLLAAGPALRSSPDLGKAEGRCRAGESGPALLVEAAGLKDRSGQIKLEVYPPNDQDFLADDNVLVAAGKTFRRVEAPTPKSGAAVLCIRIPGPGTFALLVLHDRDMTTSSTTRSMASALPATPSWAGRSPNLAPPASWCVRAGFRAFRWC